MGKAGERKFLGFRFLSLKVIKRAIAPEALDRFRRRVAGLTRRTRGVSLEKMVRDLTPYLIGWRNYFGFCQTPSVLQHLDSWIRRRLRCAVWHGVEAWQETVCGAEKARRRQRHGGKDRWQLPWPVAPQRKPGLEPRPVKRLLQLPPTPLLDGSCDALTSPTAVYGPVRTVV